MPKSHAEFTAPANLVDTHRAVCAAVEGREGGGRFSTSTAKEWEIVRSDPTRIQIQQAGGWIVSGAKLDVSLEGVADTATTVRIDGRIVGLVQKGVLMRATEALQAAVLAALHK